MVGGASLFSSTPRLACFAGHGGANFFGLRRRLSPPWSQMGRAAGRAVDNVTNVPSDANPPVGPSAPLRRRPYLLAAEVPQLMADPCPRGPILPINQFVKDWFSPLADRARMIKDPVPAGSAAKDAVRIATVVHALCDQQGLQAPSWVYEHRFEEDEMLVEQVLWDTEMAAWERAHAPPACIWHRCWFGESFLEVLGVHYAVPAQSPTHDP